MDIDNWVSQPTFWILGVLVAGAAVALVARALSRARHVRRGMSPEERDRQARRIEDALTITVAAVASGLSLTGLWRYAEHVLQLEGWWRLAPYGGLDAAVIVCAIRARRRANHNQPSGWNGRLVWILALVSAAFGFSEGRTWWEGVGRAVWPIIAATLFELGLIEQRQAAEARPERRIGLGRWSHPFERLRVQARLAGNSTLTADEATIDVRAHKAAHALYRLRTSVTAAKASRRWMSWWHFWRAHRAERRAQRLLAHASFDGRDNAPVVLRKVQALVRTREIATMDYSSSRDAEDLLAQAIPTGRTPSRSKTTGRTASSPDPRHAGEDRKPTRRTAKRSTPGGGNEAAYKRYADQLDAARQRGEHIAADEPSGNEIGDWTKTHPGNARNLRRDWRQRYAVERGLTLDADGKPILNSDDTPVPDHRFAQSVPDRNGAPPEPVAVS